MTDSAYLLYSFKLFNIETNKYIKLIWKINRDIVFIPEPYHFEQGKPLTIVVYRHKKLETK